MKVDAEKLQSAVARLAEGRKDGRRKSDLMATIRALLPVIDDLRKPPPKAWAVIAAGLAEQGVTEKGGRPISERRLTSVYFKLKEQERRGVARAEARQRRPDVAALVEPGGSPNVSRGKARLAPELMEQQPTRAEAPPITEEEIMDARRRKQAHLFNKKD